MDDKTKEEFLELLYQVEEDYWNLPQYGLIADWFGRYWDLHNKLLEHLGEEPYHEPLQMRAWSERNRMIQPEPLNSDEDKDNP